MKALLHMMSFGLKTFLGHRGAGICCAIVMVIGVLVSFHVAAAPVAVRLSEGTTHGFFS